MIISFADKATEDLYHGVSSARVRRLPQKILESALYKLDILNAAQTLDDLRSPPGNRLGGCPRTKGFENKINI